MAISSNNFRVATRLNRDDASIRRALVVMATAAGNIAAFMILFQLYKMVRKAFIPRSEAIAFIHAEQIVDLERRIHLFVELDLQRWLLRHEELIRPFNRYYAFFMWSFYLCCIVAMVLQPVRYRRLRRVFLLSMVIALPWYALYPLAPPRFLPAYGFVDTLAVYGPQYFKDNGWVTGNHYAAMPSMHVGWTTIGGFMLAAAIPFRRIGGLLGTLHVMLMSLTVVVTANHFILDIVGGWLVVAAAFGAARLIPAEIGWPWRQVRTSRTIQGRTFDRRSPRRYEKLRPMNPAIRKQSAKTP